jgi:hypothetical protein
LHRYNGALRPDRLDAVANYGRGAGLGRALEVGAGLAVAVGVAVGVAVAVGVGEGVGVGVGLGAAAQYLPPVFKKLPSYPPQTIISLSVHTAVWSHRAGGGVGGAGSGPTVGDGIISAAGVENEWEKSAAPDDHFAVGPHCLHDSGFGRVGGAGRCPTIRVGIVSPAGVKTAGATSAPEA